MDLTVYVAGVTPAVQAAAGILQDRGAGITGEPGWNVSDVLLDVPSFRPGGLTREQLHTLLTSLPRQVRLWGGNISIEGYDCVDLLKDEGYLWENAAITARCALAYLPESGRVLILGWGRIGTHLGRMLTEKGYDVTIAIRKKTDLLRLRALGYRGTLSFENLPDYNVVINTVPCPILDADQLRSDCVKLDLASVRGITGDGVIHARGLPGRYAPEESGKLIAETIWKELET